MITIFVLSYTPGVAELLALNVTDVAGVVLAYVPFYHMHDV